MAKIELETNNMQTEIDQLKSLVSELRKKQTEYEKQFVQEPENACSSAKNSINTGIKTEQNKRLRGNGNQTGTY